MAACGTVYAPGVEHVVPQVGPAINGTGAPAVAPSAAPAGDAAPANDKPLWSPQPMPQQRPVGDPELTPAPAPNAPAPALVQPSADRCNPSGDGSKVLPPACPPQ